LFTFSEKVSVQVVVGFLPAARYDVTAHNDVTAHHDVKMSVKKENFLKQFQWPWTILIRLADSPSLDIWHQKNCLACHITKWIR